VRALEVASDTPFAYIAFIASYPSGHATQELKTATLRLENTTAQLDRQKQSSSTDANAVKQLENGAVLDPSAMLAWSAFDRIQSVFGSFGMAELAVYRQRLDEATAAKASAARETQRLLERIGMLEEAFQAARASAVVASQEDAGATAADIAVRAAHPAAKEGHKPC